MTEFILASGSPRRQSLLEGIGVDFIIIKPDIDESVHEEESPEDYVVRLSEEKALTVAEQLEIPAYVLAADTTVIHDGEILGKPETEEEARRMLLRLRGQKHRVCTGFTLLLANARREVEKQITRVVCSEVTMRPYAASEMERWIKSGHAFDKAGGYAIQSMTFPSVEHVEGSYNNVVGLPTEALVEVLEEIGWSVDDDLDED